MYYYRLGVCPSSLFLHIPFSCLVYPWRLPSLSALKRLGFRTSPLGVTSFLPAPRCRSIMLFAICYRLFSRWCQRCPRSRSRLLGGRPHSVGKVWTTQSPRRPPGRLELPGSEGARGWKWAAPPRPPPRPAEAAAGACALSRPPSLRRPPPPARGLFPPSSSFSSSSTPSPSFSACPRAPPSPSRPPLLFRPRPPALPLPARSPFPLTPLAPAGKLQIFPSARGYGSISTLAIFLSGLRCSSRAPASRSPAWAPALSLCLAGHSREALAPTRPSRPRARPPPLLIAFSRWRQRRSQGGRARGRGRGAAVDLLLEGGGGGDGRLAGLAGERGSPRG